ncbi:hypothetical protein QZH41_010773 [Actinostola sp. cb2023]|nr:hypothetical protein QZH41_010773 [Actinostola sp. cb2023]
MADNPVQFPAVAALPVAALPVAALPVEDAAQNVNLPEVQNPPQGQNAPAADQNANAAGQPLECIPTMEERLKKLEDQGKANSVAMALQSLHRTLDKARFDADEALADLETLVRQAKGCLFDPSAHINSQRPRPMRWVTRDLTPLEAMEGMSAPPCDFDFIDKIAQGAQSPNIADLPFRDPNNFLAGQLHLHARDWEELVARVPYDDAYEVLDWVGEVNAPYLVMPLTVEPTKPRLCHDNRYLNLWMVDKPFRLDNLSHLPRYLTKDSYQSVLDDKSGYNHILLEEPSRAFFGLQWKGWYFVSNTIPFGWKLSAWIYHSTGLVATHFFRSIGIPSSLYIDDRHIGELQLGTPGTIPMSATPRDRTKLTNAQDAVYVVAYTLSHLGYTLGLPKCVLTPQKQIKFLGFISDTEQEAFYLPINKQKDFLALVASILAKRHVSVHTLQRLAGKCSSFNLAIQDARLYTNEMNMAIGKALKTSKPAHLSPALRLEIEHWASPEVVSKVGKWRHEKHSQFVIFSDASKFAWGALFPEHSLIPVSDYWSPDMSLHNIAVKETKALTNAILTFRESLVNARVDAFVDNQCLVQAWRTQAARAGPFTKRALKELYSTVADQNIHLAVSYISSGENPADEPSRKLSPADCKLAPHLWSLLQEHPRFGGPSGHSIDLMALDSNTQDGKDGKPLPHFTPYPMPGSSGVDIFAQDLSSPESDPLLRNLYVFPPIILIGPVIRLLQENNCSSTIVIPDPVRLAYGSVDSQLGKLRAIFNENGRRGEWDPRLLVGNPATDISLRRYIKVITAEQLQARTLPKQATPFFVSDLVRLGRGINAKLASGNLSPIEIYCILRDQAYFKILFFSGDRPGDLGQVKSQEILRFPNNDGLLFNHTWGKTLRDGSTNLFGIRRSSDLIICPVYATELYVNHSKAIGISLTSGYLFRPITPDRGVANKSLSSSAAESRLKLYLKEFHMDESHTLHGFRSGCAITLALSGAELQDIMSHVGWKSQATASHYMQLERSRRERRRRERRRRERREKKRRERRRRERRRRERREEKEGEEKEKKEEKRKKEKRKKEKRKKKKRKKEKRKKEKRKKEKRKKEKRKKEKRKKEKRKKEKRKKEKRKKRRERRRRERRRRERRRRERRRRERREEEEEKEGEEKEGEEKKEKRKKEKRKKEKRKKEKRKKEKRKKEKRKKEKRKKEKRKKEKRKKEKRKKEKRKKEKRKKKRKKEKRKKEKRKKEKRKKEKRKKEKRKKEKRKKEKRKKEKRKKEKRKKEEKEEKRKKEKRKKEKRKKEKRKKEKKKEKRREEERERRREEKRKKREKEEEEKEEEEKEEEEKGEEEKEEEEKEEEEKEEEEELYSRVNTFHQTFVARVSANEEVIPRVDTYIHIN